VKIWSKFLKVIGLNSIGMELTRLRCQDADNRSFDKSPGFKLNLGQIIQDSLISFAKSSAVIMGMTTYHTADLIS
jgi:hypothetical protein